MFDDFCMGPFHVLSCFVSHAQVAVLENVMGFLTVVDEVKMFMQKNLREHLFPFSWVA